MILQHLHLSCEYVLFHTPASAPALFTPMCIFNLDAIGIFHVVLFVDAGHKVDKIMRTPIPYTILFAVWDGEIVIA